MRMLEQEQMSEGDWLNPAVLQVGRLSAKGNDGSGWFATIIRDIIGTVLVELGY